MTPVLRHTASLPIGHLVLLHGVRKRYILRALVPWLDRNTNSSKQK